MRRLRRWFRWARARLRAAGRVTDRWWRGHARIIDWTVLAVGTALAVVMWFAKPPPGYAIGLLAGVAAVMTFSRPSGLQRALVTLLAGGLIVLEMVAIGRERTMQRAEANQQLAAILSDNRTKTKAILDANAAQFEATESSFSSIQDLATKSLSSSNAALSEVTGAGSYAYAFPIPDQEKGNVGLGLRARGPHSLTGVTATISRRTKPQWARAFQNLGTVSPGAIPELFAQISPTAYSIGWDQYDIFITAQNGTTHELLDIRKQQGR